MTKTIKLEYKGMCKNCGSNHRPHIHNMFDGVIDTIQCQDCYKIDVLSEEMSVKQFLRAEKYKVKG